MDELPKYPVRLQQPPRGLRRKLSFWLKGPTSAADVNKALVAAAKAHKKYATKAGETCDTLRQWSSQLDAPAFAPELGDPNLKEFMLQLYHGIKPDATTSEQLQEILLSAASSFECIANDEVTCKNNMHELATAQRGLDKSRSSHQDSGLYEKTCEHWEARLTESIRMLKSQSEKLIRTDIDFLVEYLEGARTVTAKSVDRISKAYEPFEVLPTTPRHGARSISSDTEPTKRISPPSSLSPRERCPDPRYRAGRAYYSTNYPHDASEVLDDDISIYSQPKAEGFDPNDDVPQGLQTAFGAQW